MLLTVAADHPFATGGNAIVLVIISILFTVTVIYIWRKSKGFEPELEDEEETDLS